MPNTDEFARADTLFGLSAEEVSARKSAGQVNKTNEKAGKSYFRIVLDNLCTFFNLVWAAIAVLMIILGRFDNLTFLAIIIPNVLIAIVQEWRAKRTVEKLSVTTDPKATVIREGREMQIPADEIVLGDLVVTETGGQILADAKVVSGLAEANESMLTGESVAIRKAAGDTVLAGSYLVSGKIVSETVHVGNDNYVHTIEKAAKKYKPPVSDLFRDLNRLLRYIGILMIPMAAVMYFSNLSETGSADAAITNTCGSVIGMIPAGIYLLITVTLTLSVISLARKKTLVQDMYSIEMLARADVVCLDKTGTITDGTMCVTDVVPLAAQSEAHLMKILSVIEGASDSLNATSRAIVEKCGKSAEYPISDRIPFSSERKYSAVTADGLGTFSLGAPHFVPCPISSEVDAQIEALAKEGKRVLVLAEQKDLGDTEGVPLALIAICDRIRPNAAETIAHFQAQGVTVKIISGDHAATVAAIAERVGVANADKALACNGLSDEELAARAEEYTVFGRVTPEQKVLLVKKLRSLGHVVAMTGDGVNDTLALREANCAISMADGSEMARKVSQIVLLESDFGTLPDVVYEGRRCINNVRQSATLFLMKTGFTILLSLFTVLTFSVYPFEPKHLTLIEMFIIGIASVLLALEPNAERIRGSFIKTVITQSIPSAVTMFAPVCVLGILTKANVFTPQQFTPLALLATALAAFVNLAVLCIPFTKWRAAVLAISGVLTLLAIPASLLIGDLYSLRPIATVPAACVLTLLATAAFAVLFHFLRAKLFKKRVAGKK